MLFAKYLKEELQITDIKKVNKKVVEEYLAFTKDRGKYSFASSEVGIEKANLDKTVCASFDKVKHFKKLIEATIAEKYNVDEIQTRILNGDGASWVKAICKDQDINFQLDPFHISQAILRNVSGKKEQKNY